MELALKPTATMALRSEQALVQAARRGDDRAFEQLYAEYRERVTAFIHSKVRDHGRAEDISQEVFMAALRQLRSNDQHIAFKPWIFAIAKNACIDEFRRSTRGREVPVETDDDFPTDQRASLSVVPSPPAAIESKQRLDDLRGAFGGLSESHHRLIVMRELEGRSYDEIGTRLGMTRQMVESGLFRARRKLSAEYDELASGRRCEQVQTVIDSGAAVKLRTLGIKERRRLTQHLSHCQGCRQQARLAGVDETLLKPRSIAARIAALVPFGGLWRWPWRHGGSAPARAHASAHVTASGAAQAAGAAGSSVTIGQAAATVAALALAGAGGGIAIAQHDHAGHRSPAHHVTTRGAGGSVAGRNPASAAQATAGSTSTGTGRTASHAFSARRTTAGSKTGATALGTGTTSSGTNSPVPGRNQPTGGSGSPTSSTGASNSTPSSGSSATSPLTTTINHPGDTLNKVTAPVKKITDPITKATNPVSGTVNKVLSSPPVKSVTDPVNKVLSSPPVKSVTDPITKATNPVTSPPPVKSVTDPITKATNPVTSAPPVKKVGSTVGGTVQKVLPPASTTPSSGSTGSGGSQSPLPTPTKVVGGL
ncbi:MAG TPA: sigma-70 family RNA polymerase sigma factor [Solirubrobacteraceae bacterium]|nr:sigma-70 family RNA polymerase sigma factor [Solirubrobacteraceae bacterium]